VRIVRGRLQLTGRAVSRPGNNARACTAALTTTPTPYLQHPPPTPLRARLLVPQVPQVISLHLGVLQRWRRALATPVPNLPPVSMPLALTTMPLVHHGMLPPGLHAGASHPDCDPEDLEMPVTSDDENSRHRAAELLLNMTRAG